MFDHYTNELVMLCEVSEPDHLLGFVVLKTLTSVKSRRRELWHYVIFVVKILCYDSCRSYRFVDISLVLTALICAMNVVFELNRNGFQKLEKMKDANRRSRQLEELTDKMRECKRYISAALPSYQYACGFSYP